MTSKKDPTPVESDGIIPFDDIKDLIAQVSELDIEEVELEKGDFRVHIVGKRTHAPVQSVVAAPAEGLALAPQVVANSDSAAPQPAAAEEKVDDDSHLKKVTSPMVGSFYRSPAPESPPFAKVGDHVTEDTVLCIIEAMKLMNEIKAETSGRIAKVYVENGQPVEYGQPMFGIESD